MTPEQAEAHDKPVALLRPPAVRKLVALLRPLPARERTTILAQAIHEEHARVRADQVLIALALDARAASRNPAEVHVSEFVLRNGAAPLQSEPPTRGPPLSPSKEAAPKI